MAYQPQQPYYSPPPVYYGPQTQSCGLAVFSMIAGIVSWFLCPGIAAIAAIITGHIAKGQIRDSNGRLTGSGMATAGLILGYTQIIIGFLALCVYLVFVVGIFGIAGLSEWSSY